MTPYTTILLALIATSMVTAQCPGSLQACNGACYDSKVNSCPTDDFTGKPFLCGVGYAACNGACYSPSLYTCKNGTLQSGAASTSPVVTSSIPVLNLAVKTPSSSQPATSIRSTSSSQVAATQSATTCDTTGCGVGLCNCNGACYTLGLYNCPTDSATNKLVLCPGSFGACNGQCFDTTKQSCVNGALQSGGGAQPAQPTQAYFATSSSAPAAAIPITATPTPVVNPTPAPAQYPKQTADLRIINSCKTTLWFEARYGNQGAPIPGQASTAVRALPGSYVDYTVPDAGLPGTRFWAKYGCDANGKNCLIGDQMQYWPNPPGGCPATGCTPPVDSLFEATWGCRPGASCNAQNPTTWFDTSQVDGWTIPYKLTPNGDTSKCDCIGDKCGFKGVDASTLDLAKCPKNENLVTKDQSLANVLGQSLGLDSVDLRIIKNNQVLGCMSPCKRLNWGVPYGLGQPENSGSTMWMCCPTPTPASCSSANGCISPDVCRAGPIEKTQFVNAVHGMAPGVYSYSYDDGVGLHACPAGVTTYTMEFCPTGSAQYPLQL